MKNQKFVSGLTFLVIALLITSASSIASINMEKINTSSTLDSFEDKTQGIQSVKGDVYAQRLSVQSEKIGLSQNYFPLDNQQPPVPLGVTVGDWWDSDWLYRKEIQINSSKVDTNLTNFSVLISLVSDFDLRDHTQSDGDDIIFADKSNTKLDHEIEYYDDETGQLVAWVRIPILSSSVDTILYLYYGNLEASNQQNVVETWNSNYVIVQHLEETTGTHYDSTGNHNDGEWNDENGQGSQDAIGIIDGANQFDGVDDYVDCGNDDSLNVTEEITIEAWIFYQGGEENHSRIIDKYPAPSIYINTSTDKLGWYGFINGSSKDFQFQNTTILRNNWTHLVVSYANDSEHAIKAYVNGELNMSITSYSGALNSTTANLLIGNSLMTDDAFNGTIDEIRVSKKALNESWISTEYYNQYDPYTFYSTGDEEIFGDVNMSGLIGNEKHPAISMDKSGNLFGAYDYEEESEIIWTFSTDGGKTWDHGYSYEIINGFERYPSVDYWGSRTTFYGTFVTPIEVGNGGYTYLFECTDPTNTGTYNLVAWDWNTKHKYYGMKMIEIACTDKVSYPTITSEDPWGFQSLIISHPDMIDGPYIMYPFENSEKPGETGWATISWISGFEGCNSTTADIDLITHKTYAVYDWYNTSVDQWQLIIRQDDDYSKMVADEIYDTSLVVWFYNDSNLNILYPDVAVYNDNLVIVAETEENGSKDIICLYSDNGINDGELSESVVADSIDDESYPELSWIQGTTFLCAFVKGGNLFVSITKDGGATWSTPKQINDVDGSVVNEYKTADLCDTSFKVLWEDARGVDIDIYFEDFTHLMIPPINSKKMGYVQDEDDNYLPGVTITAYNQTLNWRASTKTDDEGYYELRVFGGGFTLTAVKEGYYPEEQNIFVNPNKTIWVYFVLTEFYPSLRIGPISGGFGVSAVIENIGDGAAHDVEWSIRFDGGLVPQGRRIYTGTFQKLNPRSAAIVDTLGKDIFPLFQGFGRINITVTLGASGVKNITKNSKAFLLGFWVTMRDIKFPLRTKVSGYVTDNETGKLIRFARVIAKPTGRLLGRFTRTHILLKPGFYRLKLLPGTYDVTVRKWGYIPQTKSITVGFEPFSLHFALVHK